MNSYYRSIFERFNKAKKQENSNKKELKDLGLAGEMSKTNLDESNQPPILSNSECSRKRDENFERKTHSDLIENFIEINSVVNSTTMKRYINILQDFKQFSTNFDPRDVFLI